MDTFSTNQTKVHHARKEQELDIVHGTASVPWESKDDWRDVYRKLYSRKLSDQVEAYNKMVKWQRFCPLGVICTRTILQGVIKDKMFHSDVQNGLDVEDLQYIYGGSIMKFLNLLGSKEVANAYTEEKGNESLYAKAEKIGIPDWIVNVRHNVSHGITLPEIGLLRLCIIYILDFLKTNYWEIENEKLQETILERPREETLKEYFTKLMNLYLLVKEQQKYGHTCLKSVEDLQIREDISRLEEYRLVSEQSKNAPWEVNYQKKHLSGELDVHKTSLNKISILITKYITEYYSANNFGMWNIITFHILQDSMTHLCIRLDIWGNLIRRLADRGFIKQILEVFMDYVFAEHTDYNACFWARKWLIVIFQALIKRAKVHRLKMIFSGKLEMKKWEKKIISTLSMLERDHLKQLIARRKHDQSRQIIMRIYTKLFSIIEKNDKKLKSALRFKCRPLNSETLKDYIFKVCHVPNDFSLTALDFLVNMVENPSMKAVRSLKTIMGIYRGNVKSSAKSTGTLYTLDMLMDKLDTSEKEYLEWKLKAHPPDTNKSEKELNCTSVQTIDGVVFGNSSVVTSLPNCLKIPWNSFY